MTLPIASFVTLKAVPTQIVVEPRGITLLHPLRIDSIPAAEVVGGKVVDHDTVRIDLVSRSLRWPELADHPHDRDVRTSEEPADRLEASLARLVEQTARPAA
jgi:hypothetical protein